MYRKITEKDAAELRALLDSYAGKQSPIAQKANVIYEELLAAKLIESSKKDEAVIAIMMGLAQIGVEIGGENG